MDARRLHELAGKHACEVRACVRFERGELKPAGFDDDCDWSDGPAPNAAASTLSVKTLSGLDSCYSKLLNEIAVRTRSSLYSSKNVPTCICTGSGSTGASGHGSRVAVGTIHIRRTEENDP